MFENTMYGRLIAERKKIDSILLRSIALKIGIQHVNGQQLFHTISASLFHIH